MQYALLIYGAEGRWEQFSEEEQQAMTEQYMAISRDAKTKGGADLGDLSQATTVRVDNGKTLTTDGPFAETKEYLGGFYLIDCETKERAIELAAQIPDAAIEGLGVEVRQVMFADGTLEA